MSPDPSSLAARVSSETGLAFAGTQGRGPDGSRWIELRPAEHAAAQTFTLRAVIGWRRIDVHFMPGSFAGDLISHMATADRSQQLTFRAVLQSCRKGGAEVSLALNGSPRDPDDDALWETQWRSVELSVRRGMLAINEGDDEADLDQLALWTSRTAAAVLSLLPLEIEGDDELAEPEVDGLPEGAKTRVEVNRYERDRRNRSAALAIHGHACKACDLDMGERYGASAAGYIEVHHVTPVSQVGEGYIIDPRTDLVPLCPNCHSVAHRRSPPFSVDELRMMLAPTDAPN